MNEAQLYEALGRKQAALENEQREYANLFGLVKRIKDGAVSIDDVELGNNSWNIVDDVKVDSFGRNGSE